MSSLRTILATIAGFTATLAAVGIAAADDKIPASALSPAYIVHKLAADGTELRSIEFKGGAYVVDVATSDGRTYRAAVNPDTGDLNAHAFLGRALQADTAPANSLSASLIVQQIAAAGYDDLIEMEMKNTLWKVKARDAAGRPAKLWVDPVTGQFETRGDKVAVK